PEADPPVDPDVVAEEVLGVHRSILARRGEVVRLLEPPVPQRRDVRGGVGPGEVSDGVLAAPRTYEELRGLQLVCACGTCLCGRRPSDERRADRGKDNGCTLH